MIKHALMITAIAAVPLTGALAQTATTPGTTTTPPAATTTPTTPMTSASIDYIRQQTADQVMASRLIGMTVRGSADENIGEVNDLVLDKDGRTAAVVIGVGGFLGIGEKNVGVPYNALTMTPDPDNSNNWRLSIAATKDALKAAPDFEKLPSRTAAGSSATTGATGSGTGTMPRTNAPQ